VTVADPDYIEGVDPQVARALRRLSGMERLALGHEISEIVRDRLRAHLAALHPEWSPEEIQKSVAQRMLDDPPMTFLADVPSLLDRVLKQAEQRERSDD
jgi:hypothetical protein